MNPDHLDLRRTDCQTDHPDAQDTCKRQKPLQDPEAKPTVHSL